MFGMRSFAGNFTPEELKTAVELCHSKGVRVHVTCNTMPRNDEVSRLPAWLELIADAGVDAVIMADLGVFALAGKHAPGSSAMSPPRQGSPITKWPGPGTIWGRTG